MAQFDPFKLINDEAEAKEKSTPKPLAEYQIEAYQIVRITKSQGLNENRREVLDTIMVYAGQDDVAKVKAQRRAKRLGHCMVIAKMEKVISSYEEPSLVDDSDNAEKKYAVTNMRNKLKNYRATNI